MVKKERGLGRGLLSLMDRNYNEELPIIAEEKTKILQIDKISPNLTQPRKFFDQEKLDELVESIKSKGILQPIIVRNIDDNNYQIIAGERRWRAAKILNIPEIPVIIKNISDKEVIEYAIIENVQRDNLTLIEEAKSYKKLISEFNYTQDMVSKIIGKSRSHIANLIRILSLSDEILEMIETNKLSLGHAKLLINNPDQLNIAKLCLENDWTVRNLEEFLKNPNMDKKNDLNSENVAKINKDRTEKKPIFIEKSSYELDFVKDQEIISLEETLSEKINMQIKINPDPNMNESGEIIICYKNLKDLDLLIKKLYSIERLVEI